MNWHADCLPGWCLACETRWPRHRQQCRQIEVILEVVGEHVEGMVDQRIISDDTGPSEPCQKYLTIRVAGEQPVQIASGDAAIGADRTVGPAAETEHRPRQPCAAGDAEMHLVAVYRGAAGQFDAGRRGETLVATQNGLDIEQTHSRRFTRRALTPVRIGNPMAEHLIAAADAEDLSTMPVMGQEVDIPAFPAQEGQIGERRLRPWEDHHGCVARQWFARPHQKQLDRGLQPQRVEIVEIGDVGEGRHRDLDPIVWRCGIDACISPQCQRVFGRQPACFIEVRNNAKAGPLGALANRRHPAIEQAPIATELVDDVAGEQSPFRIGQQRMRPDQLGNDAAALDIADQRHRNVGCESKAHIGDVAVAQIYLCRAAGAFDEDKVRGRREAIVCR
jgi:hypothetical protein